MSPYCAQGPSCRFHSKKKRPKPKPPRDGVEATARRFVGTRGQHGDREWWLAKEASVEAFTKEIANLLRARDRRAVRKVREAAGYLVQHSDDCDTQTLENLTGAAIKAIRGGGDGK